MDELLTQRRRQVLEALVNEYIGSALPVASRTICERYGIGVSPATVRSELQSLEETGYVVSPHTSAGRIPTDSGYRAFVDDILVDATMPDEHTVRQLDIAADEVDDLIRQTCAALTRLTRCLSILLSPRYSKAKPKQVTLVALSARRVLVVLITTDGQVNDGQIDLNDDVDPTRLSQMETMINGLLSKAQDTDDITFDIPLAFDERDSALAHKVIGEIARLSHLFEEGRIHHLGMSALLSQPEFSNSDQMMPIASLLEDDMAMLRLLGDVIATRQVVVRIGHENAQGAMHEASIVAKGYEVKGSAGLVAVIGPTRMDYAKAIPAVSAASRMLEDVL